MTKEEAYIEGFCKAAEAAGVNPVELYKLAGLKGRLAGLAGKAVGGLATAGKSVGGKAKGAGARFLELLRGGNADVMKPLHANSGLDGLLARPLFGPNGVASGAAAAGAGAVVPHDPAVARAVRLEKVLAPLRRRLNAIRGGSVDRAITSEARKALAAQLAAAGTAAAAVGGAGYGVGRKSGGNA